MEDFLLRFGQVHHETGEHYFSNVRNGLIVGLVSFVPLGIGCTTFEQG